MKAERKWFMSSYAFKLASERPWEALIGPTGGDPTNQDKVDVHMEGSQTSLLVSVYLALCSLESEEWIISSYIPSSQIVHVCLPPFPPSLFHPPPPSNVPLSSTEYLPISIFTLSLPPSFTPFLIPSFLPLPEYSLSRQSLCS